MLKKLRITLAVLSILAITACFLDVTGLALKWFGWLPKIQFLPAVLALNLGVVALLIALTLIFGRIYCSVICPLGIMQDFFTWLRGKFKIRKKKMNRFNYLPNPKWVRTAVLVLFIIMLAIPVTHVIATLIAPYSAYGRIVNSLLAPVYDAGNNMLADWSAKEGNYDFSHVTPTIYPAIIRVIALATLVILGIVAFLKGRAYCNTVCPVGTVLGWLARFSLLKPYIDVSKCNGCTKCARNCKASCIDPKAHMIDYTRCIDCMDCIENCSTNAISYGIPKKSASSGKPEKVDGMRRAALVGGLIVAGASVASAAEKLTDGGFAKLKTKENKPGRRPIVPPGAVSVKNLRDHCTACQLCIAACPNDVLRPSSDFGTLMQPVMGFENGFCRVECTACSDVCPAGAIKPIGVEGKASISVGVAKVNLDTCVSASGKDKCGNCERHCPADAIVMTEGPSGKLFPAVNESRCIGCGTCENLCPVNPISAIVVEGREVHTPV